MFCGSVEAGATTSTSCDFATAKTFSGDFKVASVASFFAVSFLCFFFAETVALILLESSLFCGNVETGATTSISCDLETAKTSVASFFGVSFFRFFFAEIVALVLLESSFFCGSVERGATTSTSCDFVAVKTFSGDFNAADGGLSSGNVGTFGLAMSLSLL